MKDVMHREGFHQVGEVAWQFPVKIFWHQGERIQVSVIDSNPYLLKASKSYRMTNNTPEGQQYARDLSSLQDYLESHFAEMHISVSTFRDITPSMIFRKLGVKGLDSDAANRLADTQELRNLAGDDRMINDLLADELEQLKESVEEQASVRRFAREYDKKAVSVSYVFSYSSNLQATQRENFTDTLLSVIREVRNYHRYEVMQKLQGGRLQIFIEEVTHPDFAFQIEWAGGVLNPRQLEKLGPEFDGLRKKMEDYLMIFPTSDIEGAEEKKLFGAKAIQVFLNKLKKVEETPDIPNLPREGGWIGNVMSGNKVTSVPYLFPIERRHKYCSGTTTSGKSNAARIIVENAILEGIDVVILDPTKQWLGLGLPTKDFSRFKKLGIDRNHARGFPINIVMPGEPIGDMEGCTVFCLKGLTDKERCGVAEKVLRKIYDSMGEETGKVRRLIVLEEAHLYVTDNEVGGLIRGTSRQGAKYGDILLIVTQSLTDFRREERIVREMVTVRVILQATDIGEHRYIEHYISKEAVEVGKTLGQGEAIINMPGFPWTKVFMRPPFSSVKEPSDEEIQKFRRCKMEIQTGLSEKEEQALRIIRDYHKFNEGAILASAIASKMKLSGRVRTELFNSLEQKGLVKRVEIKLEKEGRPAHAFIPFN